MAKRKRDIKPSGPASPSRRRKSTRIASKKATSRSGGDGSHGQSRIDRSRRKNLSSAALSQEVSKIVKNNKGKAELMILELMRKFSFDLSDLRKLLRREANKSQVTRLIYIQLIVATENDLNVSFSKVQYVDIAPRVGLDPRKRGEDIPTFEMFHARLPKASFPIIIGDLRRLEKQYGSMAKHENEEARSRYLSGVGNPSNFRNPTVIGKSLLTSRQFFNEIVALFSGLLFNTPETILEGRLATKGRIEYQFKTYGGITVVFIEVKLELGGLTERLNCLAQVIVECDGMVRDALDLDID